MINEKEIAKKLFDAIGGRENVKMAEHCATRLRLILNDSNKLDKEAVESIHGVSGYFYQSGQHQIILGTGLVNKVFEEMGFQKGGGTDNSNENDFKSEAYANMSPLMKAIRIIADTFIPLIPVLVAAGIFMGLRNMIFQMNDYFGWGMTSDSGFWVFTQMLTDTAYIYLPALVVWSSAKRMGATPAIGLVTGLMLTAPMLPDAWGVALNGDPKIYLFPFFEQKEIFGIMGFQGMIVPALIAGIVVAKIELWIRKWMPNSLSLIFTGFLTFLIATLISFYIVAPIFMIVQDGILWLFTAILMLPFGIGAFIIGSTMQLLVITGLHHSVTILENVMLADPTIGVNLINPIGTSSIAAATGVGLYYAISRKSAEDRAINLSNATPAFFGITEPVLYGTILKAKYLLPAMMLAGGITAVVASYVITPINVIGVTMLPGIFAYIGQGALAYIGVIGLGITLGFILAKVFRTILEKK